MGRSDRVVDLRKGKKIFSRAERYSPAPRRQSPLRMKRRRFRAVASAISCVLVLGFAYGVHVTSYLPAFTFQHISIRGANTAHSARIQGFVEGKLAASSRGFISNRNIMTFDFSALERSILDDFPQIKSATISRDSFFGNGMTIVVEERMPFARWCQSGESGDVSSDCFIIDPDGLVFAHATDMATSTFATQYVFGGGLSTTTQEIVSTSPIREVFAAGHISSVLTLLESLKEIGFPAKGAQVQNIQDFSIQLEHGFYLKASFGDDAETLAKNFKLVLSSDALKDKIDRLEYIDLRFGNRVYYKLSAQGGSASDGKGNIQAQ